MAERFDNATKIMAILAVIFFISLMIIFFVLEFRFLKNIMVDYENNIKRIVLGEMQSFQHELELYTDIVATRLTGDNSRDELMLADMASTNNRMVDIKILNKDGKVLCSLREGEGYTYPREEFKQARQGRPYSFTISQGGRVSEVAVAARLAEDLDPEHYLLVFYRINDLQHKFLMQYTTNKMKIALVDNNNRLVVWPFTTPGLTEFPADRTSYSAAGAQYDIQRTALAGSNLQVLFFFRDDHFDTYRIMVIMLLLFALYFLIYHFIVEAANINNVNSYFDDINFNVFNNLQEGIILTNNNGVLVFANNAVYQIFDGKKITPGKTALEDLIGPVDEAGGKMTLKKSDSLLDIIRSPIIKNGKMLGSLVVIGPDREWESLCQRAMGRVFEHLQDGLVFVDREGKIVACNMMARYYLGNLDDGMKIDEVSTELTSLVEKHIGSTHMVREKLTWSGVFCELLPVLDGNGLYAGTLIFIKNEAGYEQ